MMYDDAGWGWWVMGVIVLLVVIVVAVAAAVVLAARPRPAQVPTWADSGRPAPEASAAQSSPAALEALDLRLARGEVDEETYRRTRDLLTRPPGR